MARARNAKKQAALGKGKAGTEGGNKAQGLESRKERDADIMRRKTKKNQLTQRNDNCLFFVLFVHYNN